MRWWKKNDREHDMEQEFASHLELEIEEQRAKGLSVEEARYAAQLAFGNTTLIKEQTREAWGMANTGNRIEGYSVWHSRIIQESYIYICLRPVTSTRRLCHHRHFRHL
jgi:hypothetical protein